MADTIKKLTVRNKLFCKEYIKDFKGTKAAIRAKYSKKTAHAQANRLLKDAEIQKEIQRLINKELNTTPEELQYRLLQELKAIAYCRPEENQEIVTETIPATEDNPEYTIQHVVTKDTKDFIHKGAVVAIKENEKGVIEVKYGDKLKAIEILGKHGGLFEGSAGNVPDEKPLTREETIARIKELNEKNQK